MFNRYWRSYPWGLQVVLFMLMVFTLVSFASLLALVIVPRVTGLPYASFVEVFPASTLPAIRANLIVEGLVHIGMFLLPASLFAAFTHPKPAQFLGLRQPGKRLHWLLVTGIMVGLLPFFLKGEAWSQAHLFFGTKAQELQVKNDQLIRAYLNLNGPGDLALLLIVLSLLPAVGEELLFRGVLLRLLHRRVLRVAPTATVSDIPVMQDVQRTMVFPVVTTSLLFAFIHFNAHGFIFIFIAGCMLALIYSLTGSLLCSIWGHLLYNGTQVVLVYLSHYNKHVERFVDGTTMPLYVPVAGLALFAACFYKLVKTQTPLPADWSDNFREEAVAF